MAQILLISNDEIVNSLYPLNINLYLGLSIELSQSWEEAEQELNAQTNIDFIIALSNYAKSILDYCTKRQFTTPILLLGEYESPLPTNVKLINGKFKLQDTLKMIAAHFHITSKLMVHKKVAEFYPIAVKIFAKLSKVSTEIYIADASSESGHKQIADKSDIIEKVLRLIKTLNVETIYVPSSDRFKVVNEITEKLMLAQSNISMNTNEQMELNEQCFELVGGQVGDLQVINEDIIKLHKACIESSREIAKKMPGLKDLLDGLLNNKAGFVYAHSILTSFVCSHIIKHVSWGGTGHSEKLAYISFYHDIFLVPLYKKYPHVKDEQDFLRLQEITEVEQEIVINHARMIGDMIAKFPKTPIGSDVILRQHHGESHGIGFATDFKEDLSPLAKVFVIAEAYVMEILKEQNYPLEDKLNLNKFNKKLVIEDLMTRFKRVSYKKIIETLEKVPI